jgi:hypothetical protein
MSGDQKPRVNGQCQARLDRLIFTAVPRDKAGIKNVPGFKRVSDFIPQPQGKVRTYSRVSKFRSTTSSCQIVVQYDPQLPWLAPSRITIIGDDATGITLEDIEGVISQCHHHTLTLVELAVDFPLGNGIDRNFVRRYGRFGKSRLRQDRGGPEALRYGGRACPKLIRAYLKQSLGVFRVEAEVHRALLRKWGARKVGDLGAVATKLVPAHLKFACVRWKKLDIYLAKKFGQDGNRIGEETRRRADSSLRAATRYLAKNGVPNPHRFLGSLRINRDVRDALKRWALWFSPDH